MTLWGEQLSGRIPPIPCLLQHELEKRDALAAALPFRRERTELIERPSRRRASG